jgi:hypothetical protein
MTTCVLRLPDYLARRLDRALKVRGLDQDDFCFRAVVREIEASETGRVVSAFKLVAKLFCFSVITAILTVVGIGFVSHGLPVTLSAGTSFLLDFLKWLGEVLKRLFPWPVVIMFLIHYFFRSPTAFSAVIGLFGRFRRIKAFGAEIELDEQGKRKLQAVASDITQTVSDYRTQINTEVSRLVDQKQLELVLEKFVEEHLKPLYHSDRMGDSFRCTLHISDPVQQGQLYQLLNYYPAAPGSDNTASRVFSERFGIIGKVWRSGDPIVEGNLLRGLTNPTPEQIISQITKDWGATRQEAQRMMNRFSYACFLIEKGPERLATFFMDSTEKFAFIPATFEGDIENADENELNRVMEAGLTELQKNATAVLKDRIEALLSDLASISPKIDFRKR